MVDSRNFKLQKYLNNVRLKRKIEPASYSLRKYKMGVVIPVYGEYEYIGKTLQALSLNSAPCLKETMILLVINNSVAGFSFEYVSENQQLLRELRSGKLQKKYGLGKLNLFWIDASSSGYELPKKGGVGIARKLGMDAVLAHLEWGIDPLIISLDADTLVEKNYLESIESFFEDNKNIVAASINYKHLPGNTPEEEKIIREYEHFIKDYIEKLKKAGSPYAYHTIGSALACRAAAYVKVGGMKTHRGGEDFYFMQALRKLGEIGAITNTTVFQSPRVSNRVPFGTGPKIQQVLNGKEIKLYNPKIFVTLKDTLQKAENWINSSEITVPEVFISSLMPEVRPYLLSIKFGNIWPGILNNNVKNINKLKSSDKKKLLWAFHVWFDAFKTLKFVHYLEKNYPHEYSRVSIKNAD